MIKITEKENESERKRKKIFKVSLALMIIGGLIFALFQIFYIRSILSYSSSATPLSYFSLLGVFIGIIGLFGVFTKIAGLNLRNSKRIIGVGGLLALGIILIVVGVSLLSNTDSFLDRSYGVIILPIGIIIAVLDVLGGIIVLILSKRKK